MTDARWARVKDLFNRAVDLEPSDRRAFVELETEGDDEMRREVLSLVASYEESSQFIEGSVVARDQLEEVWADGEPFGTDAAETLELPGPARRDLTNVVVGGKYRVDALIGEGGMGSVYAATDLKLRRPVAMKLVKGDFGSETGLVYQRFEREAVAVAGLRHPNVVTIYDYGVDVDNGAYIVMELLSGTSLRHEMVDDEGHGVRFDPARAVEILRQVASGVDAAHKASIVHRDLKPQNIFLEPAEDGVTAKVLDFGIAKAAHESGTSTDGLTETGAIIGTPSYMSPEQCRDQPLDHRSDIYSLGVIAYELLAGRLPFVSRQQLTLVYMQVHEKPTPLAEFVPGCPRALSDVVDRMLAKDPAARYATASECARAMLDAIGKGSARSAVEPTLEAPLPATEVVRIPPLPRRRPAAMIAAGAGVLAVALGLLWGMNPTTPRVPDVAPDTKPARPAPTVPENFVLIAGGTVPIGRDPGSCDGNPHCEVVPAESPAHSVALEPYYIGTYEVTNREYHEFVAATGRRAPKDWKDGTYRIGTDAYPVTDVSWEDAVAYCAWRSRRDALDFRLPTEHEWEHAARGHDARLFPWGDVWNEQFANANKTSEVGTPLPVNQPPNNTTDRSEAGVLGLAGNVSEWTGSGFTVYPGSSYAPKGADRESRVFRGGYYRVVPSQLRTTLRAWHVPTFSAPFLGFRLAMTPRSDQDRSQ